MKWLTDQIKWQAWFKFITTDVKDTCICITQWQEDMNLTVCSSGKSNILWVSTVNEWNIVFATSESITFMSLNQCVMILLVHYKVTPGSIKIARTHLYTWVEGGILRVECLAPEHNTMSSARAQTWTARSTGHRASYLLTCGWNFNSIIDQQL